MAESGPDSAPATSLPAPSLGSLSAFIEGQLQEEAADASVDVSVAVGPPGVAINQHAASGSIAPSVPATKAHAVSQARAPSAVISKFFHKRQPTKAQHAKRATAAPSSTAPPEKAQQAPTDAEQPAASQHGLDVQLEGIEEAQQPLPPPPAVIAGPSSSSSIAVAQRGLEDDEDEDCKLNLEDDEEVVKENRKRRHHHHQVAAGRPSLSSASLPFAVPLALLNAKNPRPSIASGPRLSLPPNLLSVSSSSHAEGAPGTAGRQSASKVVEGRGKMMTTAGRQAARLSIVASPYFASQAVAQSQARLSLPSQGQDQTGLMSEKKPRPKEIIDSGRKSPSASAWSPKVSPPSLSAGEEGEHRDSKDTEGDFAVVEDARDLLPDLPDELLQPFAQNQANEADQGEGNDQDAEGEGEEEECCAICTSVLGPPAAVGRDALAAFLHVKQSSLLAATSSSSSSSSSSSVTIDVTALHTDDHSSSSSSARPGLVAIRTLADLMAFGRQYRPAPLGVLACGHFYDYDCISRWSEVTTHCCMCKAPFSEVAKLEWEWVWEREQRKQKERSKGGKEGAAPLAVIDLCGSDGDDDDDDDDVVCFDLVSDDDHGIRMSNKTAMVRVNNKANRRKSLSLSSSARDKMSPSVISAASSSATGDTGDNLLTSPAAAGSTPVQKANQMMEAGRQHRKKKTKQQQQKGQGLVDGCWVLAERAKKSSKIQRVTGHEAEDLRLAMELQQDEVSEAAFFRGPPPAQPLQQQRHRGHRHRHRHHRSTDERRRGRGGHRYFSDEDDSSSDSEESEEEEEHEEERAYNAYREEDDEDDEGERGRRGTGSSASSSSAPAGIDWRCRHCHSEDDDANLLACDGCNEAWHTYCVRPVPLEEVPEGHWLCSRCEQELRQVQLAYQQWRSSLGAAASSSSSASAIFSNQSFYSLGYGIRLPSNMPTITKGIFVHLCTQRLAEKARERLRQQPQQQPQQQPPPHNRPASASASSSSSSSSSAAAAPQSRGAVPAAPGAGTRAASSALAAEPLMILDDDEGDDGTKAEAKSLLPDLGFVLPKESSLFGAPLASRLAPAPSSSSNAAQNSKSNAKRKEDQKRPALGHGSRQQAAAAAYFAPSSSASGRSGPYATSQRDDDGEDVVVLGEEDEEVEPEEGTISIGALKRNAKRQAERDARREAKERLAKREAKKRQKAAAGSHPPAAILSGSGKGAAAEEDDDDCLDFVEQEHYEDEDDDIEEPPPTGPAAMALKAKKHFSGPSASVHSGRSDGYSSISNSTKGSSCSSSSSSAGAGAASGSGLGAKRKHKKLATLAEPDEAFEEGGKRKQEGNLKRAKKKDEQRDGGEHEEHEHGHEEGGKEEEKGEEEQDYSFGGFLRHHQENQNPLAGFTRVPKNHGLPPASAKREGANARGLHALSANNKANEGRGGGQ